MKNINCILILNLINFFLKWKYNYEGIDFYISIVIYFLYEIYYIIIYIIMVMLMVMEKVCKY